jgi:hypothetical protein
VVAVATGLHRCLISMEKEIFTIRGRSAVRTMRRIGLMSFTFPYRRGLRLAGVVRAPWGLYSERADSILGIPNYWVSRDIGIPGLAAGERPAGEAGCGDGPRC